MCPHIPKCCPPYNGVVDCLTPREIQEQRREAAAGFPFRGHAARTAVRRREAAAGSPLRGHTASLDCDTPPLSPLGFLHSMG